MSAPTQCALPHVGTYRRTLRAGVETLYRNALDWEHLSYLHGSSFTAIECLDAGDWGWRARVDFQPEGSGRWAVQELRLDREHRRWINTTLEGANPGTEVWTVAVPLGADTTEVIVDFFHPGLKPESRENLSRVYCELWDRLYDEDERVMMGQERERAGRPGGVNTLALGPLAELRKQLPRVVEFRARSFRVLELEGQLVAHATRCPHRGASLADCAVEDGRITCPFHGYVFDLRSGESADGRGLRLPRAPQVLVGADGEVTLTSA